LRTEYCKTQRHAPREPLSAASAPYFTTIA
jgi:hypothetical protein